MGTRMWYPYPRARVWVSRGLGADGFEFTHGLPVTCTTPLFQMRVGGGVCSLNPPHSPSLTSNASWRGCFQSSSTTAPPTPPPLLQMRVGGGGLVLIYHTTTPPPIPPPSLQMRAGGVFSVFTHHTTTHPPPSLQMQVRGIVFSPQPPPTSACHQPPSVARNTGRGVFFHHPHSACHQPPTSPTLPACCQPPPSLETRLGGFFFVTPATNPFCRSKHGRRGNFLSPTLSACHQPPPFLKAQVDRA